ncbi:MAG: efflux transporter periplasmic adaptor subunit [Planctomycetes bacterium RBG_16_64_12]|nr:MAG: efflux transporter periplasmic adaptor subunit [Planctomycetes bacterium RBG_16_64_12]
MFQIAKFVAMVAVLVGIVYWLKFWPVPVSEHRVALGGIVAEVMGTGTLEARVKSTISPKIAGRIEKLLADQGDHVKAGQVLFTLDDAELKQQVEIAEANIASSQAALDRLKADQGQTAAVLEQSRRNQERAERLRPSGALSELDSDKALEAFRVAQAGVARAEAALVEGQKQLVAAERNLAYRQALLADSRVNAPFDGLIVRRFRDPGDIVVPGSPTLTLVSLAEIWVSAWVDETEMARPRVGQPARVVFRSEPLRSYQGQVARLGREADRETREFVVDVRVLTLPENWAVGQRAEVYIETDRKRDIPVLPTNYVVWRDTQAGVFFNVGGRAQWRPVKLGLQAREMAEVVEGLQPGDVILTASGGKLLPLEGRRLAAP